MGIQTLQVNRTRKLQETNYIQKIYSSLNPPASKASRKVAGAAHSKKEVFQQGVESTWKLVDIHNKG